MAHSRRSIARELFLCLCCAVFTALAFPNFNIWLFAWFAFVPLFFVLQGQSKLKAFLLSYITGCVFWALTVYWLAHVTLLGTVVLILYLSLYFGIFGLIASLCITHYTLHITLFISSAWVLLEFLRSHLLTGFPWALLGYSQYKNLAAIQIADITGVYGVSFLVMMVNVSLYSLIKNKRASKALALPALILLMAFAYGFFKLSLPDRQAGRQAFSIKLSVVQGNIPQDLKWDASAREYILNRYFSLTKGASLLKPDLIIWPEASSPAIFGMDGEAFERIFDLSDKTATPLLIGAVAGDGREFFNTALLIKPGQGVAQRYDKLHLVPFGEYIPLKKIIPFLQTIVPIGDITAGRVYTLFKAQGQAGENNFAALICFEDLFPGLSREFVSRGADFLVNITNDAWYKETSAPYQHLQASVFRAVENRVFLARAANTGVSGFIAPSGKIISTVKDNSGRGIFIQGFDTRVLPVYRQGLSFYTRYGDIFILLNFAYFAAFACFSIFFRAGKKKKAAI